MTHLHNTPSIVLRTKLIGEGDKLLSLFTLEWGRLFAKAVSAAKPKARMVGITEPFQETEFQLFIRKNKGTAKITGGKSVKCFSQIYNDLNKISSAAYFCELIELLTPLYQPSADKYELLKSFLSFLNEILQAEQLKKAGYLKMAFALRLLRFAGFGIPLDGSILFSSDELRILAYLDHCVLEQLFALKMSSEQETRVKRIIDRHLEEHLPRRLRTENFSELLFAEEVLV